MIEFILADMNIGFAIALCLVLALAILEGVGMLIGLSMMSLLDHISPIDLDIDIDADLPPGGITPLLGWLCLNRLPLLIWLVLFLASFGIIGYSLNYILLNNFEVNLPEFLTYALSFIFSLYATHHIGKPLSRLLPKNESSAISNNSFNGLIATITIGTARQNNPAEASLTDNFNQRHYVLVTPDSETEEFNQGQQVVLVEKKESFWLAIKFNQ
ncbi:MAG: YqiJ family protein [Colwellia sp.]|nr:YqiJ family protein [Colwellia sp.]